MKTTRYSKLTKQDWKRSIRHAGKSMKLLLTKGILSTHPPICDCEGCRMSSPVVSTSGVLLSEVTIAGLREFVCSFLPGRR